MTKHSRGRIVSVKAQSTIVFGQASKKNRAKPANKKVKPNTF